MRRVIQLFLSVVASVSFSAQKDQAMKDAIRNGAIAKICYRVVDDEGEPVSNAVAHVWFSSYSRHQDDANWKVLTDANGMFTVEHRTNESLDCGFDKDGYYHSSDQILFLSAQIEPWKSGDYIARSNDVERFYRFVDLFDWH